MPVSEEAAAPRRIPVQRMMPGDHAFVSYDDDETRWDVLVAFAHLGLARGEKVMVLADPAVAHDEVVARLGAHPPARAAQHRDQLQIRSMRGLIMPGRHFTAQRQMARLWEETDRATREGYAGFRAFIDMHWVSDVGVDTAAVMHRETNAGHLFANRAYTEVCAYDRRAFAPDVLTAMREAHPRDLIGRLGDLDTYFDGATLWLIGDADLATQARFTAALHEAVARTAASGRLEVDLGRLHFLDVRCATDLLAVVHGATGHARIEVRCEPFHARVLRHLGAKTGGRLTVAEVNPPC